MLTPIQVGDKELLCARSGLFSALADCDARPDWYTYVFVGSISSITPLDEYESEIQITPEEIFSGQPENPTIVQTSQGPCLPKLVVGDRWLFYLRKEKGKAVLLDFYGNDSLPLPEAQQQIAMLRRLLKIGNFGVLRGRVEANWPVNPKDIPGAKVTATRKSDKTHFTSITDADGRYEFPPLPPGDYKISVARAGSFRPDDSTASIVSGSCQDLTLHKTSQSEP